jgi:hypothetical protein
MRRRLGARWSQRVRWWVRIATTAAAVIISSVIILGRYPDSLRAWALCFFGVVLSYWLR